MEPAQRSAISKGAGKDPFRDRARKHGYVSQNALAKKLKISKGRLSHYRRARDPEPIPLARAKEIEKLIGWPADAEHWPGGISE